MFLTLSLPDIFLKLFATAELFLAFRFTQEFSDIFFKLFATELLQHDWQWDRHVDFSCQWRWARRSTIVADGSERVKNLPCYTIKFLLQYKCLPSPWNYCKHHMNDKNSTTATFPTTMLISSFVENRNKFKSEIYT